MTTDSSDSLVSVYTTPVAFDAELVKAMLADEGISGSVENSSGPFPGITAIPCQVFVPTEHEVRARALIAEHEAQHRERVEREFQEVTEAAEDAEDAESDV